MSARGLRLIVRVVVRLHLGERQLDERAILGRRRDLRLIVHPQNDDLVTLELAGLADRLLKIVEEATDPDVGRERERESPDGDLVPIVLFTRLERRLDQVAAGAVAVSELAGAQLATQLVVSRGEVVQQPLEHLVVVHASLLRATARPWGCRRS